MTDLDDTTINFEQVKAIATDNKDIMEKFEVDMQVQELKLKERTYKSQKYTLEDNLKVHLPKKIKWENERIEKLKIDIENRNKETKPEFEILLNNRIFKDKKEAGEAIIKSQNSKIDRDTLYEIGKYRGFKICLQNTFSDTYLNLINEGRYYTKLALVPSLNIQRLDEVLDGLDTTIEKSKQEIISYEKQMEQCKLELEKPFADEEKLMQLLQRQAELDSKLNLDNKENSEVLIEDEETEENENELEQDYSEEYDEEYNEDYDITDEMY